MTENKTCFRFNTPLPCFRGTTKGVKTPQTMRSFDSHPPVRVITLLTGSTGALIHDMRESVPHTAHFTPQRLARHDGMPLFLNMPSLGSLKRTRPPSLLRHRCCESQPHPTKLSGESDWACIGKPTHHEYWKGFLACSVHVAGFVLRFKAQWEIGFIPPVEQPAWRHAPDWLLILLNLYRALNIIHSRKEMS